MNKKFMNALLFSAALLSSGVIATSCKDYDDDIDELRNQDQANQASLTEKLSAVESSISSLQSAQTGLQTSIDEAKKAAEEAKVAGDEAKALAEEAKAAAAEGQQAAIDEAKKNLDAAKEELTALIQQGDNALKEDIDAVEADLVTCKANVEALLAFQGQAEADIEKLESAYEELNNTVAGLSTKVDDLLNRVGKAEMAITSQQTALDEYKKTNDAAVEGIQEELDGLKAQVDKWKGLDPEQLEAMDAEIKAAQEDITELNGKIATINENLATLYIAVYKGITHIEMVYGMQNAESGKTYAGSELTLLSDIAKRTYTFGTKGEKHNELNQKEKMENAQDFVEGERRRLSETLLVRVTPADAALSASEISLVDTKGTDLIKEGYVQVTGVKKFEGTGVATRTAQNENGLYEITIEVGAKADDTSFDFEKSFKELTTLNDHDVLFALGVNQSYNALAGTTTEAGVRKVTTSYELIFSEDRKDEVGKIGFDVYETDNKEATLKHYYEIKNRWDGNTGKDQAPYEYEWAQDIEAMPTWQYENNPYNAAVAGTSDNREGLGYFPVSQDVKFTVELDEETKNAKYFYISLDRAFAGESDASELKSWNNYIYSGDIDKVLDIDECNGKATLSINLGGSEYTDDVIGFRIYAVNADGTYVDPDGRAFYVEIGKAAVSLPAVKTEIVVNPYDNQADCSDFILVNGIPDNVINATYVSGYDENEIDSKMQEPIYKDNDGTLIDGNVFKVRYYDENKKEIGFGDLATGAGWKKVKYIKTEFNVNADELVDDHTYTGTITLKDGNGRVLVTIPVQATKRLPQSAPESFSIKQNQIVDGLHTNYLEPAANPQYGRGELTRVFNGLNLNEEGYEHYIITFENALRVNGEPEDLVIRGVEGTDNRYTAYEYQVAREFIDNTVRHSSKVEFDWGEISFTFNEIQDKCVASNHTVTALEFETIFSCIYDAKVLTWDWAKNTKAEITYNELYDSTNKSGMTRSLIEGTNSFNDTDFSKTLEEFVTAANKELGSSVDNMNGNYKSIALYTDVDNEATKNEYFTPSIDANGNICFKPTEHGDFDNPTADVKSTLRIVYVDIFGHDVTIDLDVTVKKR